MVRVVMERGWREGGKIFNRPGMENRREVGRVVRKVRFGFELSPSGRHFEDNRHRGQQKAVAERTNSNTS